MSNRGFAPPNRVIDPMVGVRFRVPFSKVACHTSTSLMVKCSNSTSNALVCAIPLAGADLVGGFLGAGRMAEGLSNVNVSSGGNIRFLDAEAPDRSADLGGAWSESDESDTRSCRRLLEEACWFDRLEVDGWGVGRFVEDGRCWDVG